MSSETGGLIPGTDTRAKLTALYDEYYGKIARYAYLRIGDKNEAEDLAGDVFLKALQSLKSYKEREVPMQAWLFRIAHNLVVDYLRKKSKRQTVPIDESGLESRQDAGPGPETLAERNIEMERVKKAMEQLSKEQQEVLGLRFFGEFTSKETADILNKTDGAVREMQRAAISKLRKILVVDNKETGC